MDFWDKQPVAVLWEATRRCNLSCIHCITNCGSRYNSNADLGTGEIKSAVDDLNDLNCLFFIITGGEPLLRRDLFDVAEYAHRNMDVGLTTNGTLINKGNVRKFLEFDWCDVQVSLDGDSSFHDKFRGMSGAYDGAVDAIQLLLGNGVRTSVRTVVTKQNIGKLQGILDTLLKLNVSRWEITPVISTGRAKENDMELCAGDRLRVIEFIADSRIDHHREISINAGDGFGYCGYLEPLTRTYPFRDCPAGKYTCGITYEGRLKACLDHPEPEYLYGSIRERGFHELWRDINTFSEFRSFNPDRMEGVCETCDSREVCFGGCSANLLASTGDLYSKNPYCIYQAIERKEKKKSSRLHRVGKVVMAACMLGVALLPASGTSTIPDDSAGPHVLCMCRMMTPGTPDISVSSLNLTEDYTEIEAVIKNNDNCCGVHDLEVEFFVDGEKINSEFIDLNPRENKTVNIRRESFGLHELMVRADLAEDENKTNNMMSKKIGAIKVQERDLEDNELILFLLGGAGLASLVYGVRELNKRRVGGETGDGESKE